MKKMIALMKRYLTPYMLGLLIAAVSFSARQVIFAKMLKDLYDATIAMDAQMLVSGFLSNLLWLGVCSIIQPIGGYLQLKSVALISGDIRENMFASLKRLPILFFKNEHSGDLISRFNNDLQVLQNGYHQIFPQLVFTVISGVASIAYMFILDWRIALICVLTGGVGLVVNTLYAKPLRRIGELVQDRLGALTQAFSDIYAGMPVIKSFNLQKEIINKFLGRNTEVFNASMTRVKRNSELVAWNHLTRWLDILGFVLVGAYFAIHGWVTVGVVMAISQLKNPINWLFMEMGMFVTGIQASVAAGTRVLEVIEQEPEPAVYSQLAAASETGDNHIVVMKDVKFGYDENTKLFNGLNFKVKRGSKVALAGPSGGGKSTIFKLLLGFFPAESGEVTINGKSMGSEELSKIREMIAYVPQNAHLFTGTIAENIRYGNESATDEEVIRAAQVANAHDFITGFEKGYETMVGERGAQLSGGQRQRIAIARAVLKNAPILLLDEATSSLDTESESVVQEALDRLATGRTTLVIAHRFATIKDADEIVVIAEGQVKERGTHDELLASASSLYRKLYEQQFQLTEQAS